jgi:endonuclease/exonuclease/phosphatase family metal-dependent hydrolase
MLPFGAIVKKHFQRADNIVSFLNQADYDVIVLQEVFHKKVFRLFQQGLQEKYPYQATIPRSKKFPFKITTSGVVIYSSLPILDTKYIHYNAFCECFDYDCHADKGALLVTVQKGGQKFQIVGSHLQSESHPKAQAIRKCQLEAIYRGLLLPYLLPNAPQIITGDINVERVGNPQSYRDMLRILDAVDINRAINPAFTRDGLRNSVPYGKSRALADILDYFLFRANNSKVKPSKYEVKYFRDANQKDLSDHYAIEATFIFNGHFK